MMLFLLFMLLCVCLPLTYAYFGRRKRAERIKDQLMNYQNMIIDAMATDPRKANALHDQLLLFGRTYAEGYVYFGVEKTYAQVLETLAMLASKE